MDTSVNSNSTIVSSTSALMPGLIPDTDVVSWGPGPGPTWRDLPREKFQQYYGIAPSTDEERRIAVGAGDWRFLPPQNGRPILPTDNANMVREQQRIDAENRAAWPKVKPSELKWYPVFGEDPRVALKEAKRGIAKRGVATDRQPAEPLVIWRADAALTGSREGAPNGTTHGLASQGAVPQGHSRDDFELFRVRMARSYQPYDMAEHEEFELLVTYKWKLKRLDRQEDGIYAAWEEKIGHADPDGSYAFLNDCAGGQAITRLHRYEPHLTRTYHKCQARLQLLQEQRRKDLREVGPKLPWGMIEDDARITAAAPVRSAAAPVTPTPEADAATPGNPVPFRKITNRSQGAEMANVAGRVPLPFSPSPPEKGPGVEAPTPGPRSAPRASVDT